ARRVDGRGLGRAETVLCLPVSDTRGGRTSPGCRGRSTRWVPRHPRACGPLRPRHRDRGSHVPSLLHAHPHPNPLRRPVPAIPPSPFIPCLTTPPATRPCRLIVAPCVS